MEIWDAYDVRGDKLEGRTLVRGEPIPEGVFHLVCDVLVKHKDGTYLLMQRDKGKNYGGMWEATAGGSALKGEDPLACARRELFEETGIHAADLTEVGRVVHDNIIFVEFSCVTDCPKDSVILQAGETIAYRWVSREELRGMKASGLLTKRMQGFIR